MKRLGTACVILLLVLRLTVCAVAEEPAFRVYTDENGVEYPLFEMRKMHYDEEHRVFAVSGAFERIDLEYDEYTTAYSGIFTYELAEDFHADMLKSMLNSEDWPQTIPVTDLYAWYVDSYLSALPEECELIFDCDLEEMGLNPALGNFWFVTTRIALDEDGRISYMEYYYVPWG